MTLRLFIGCSRPDCQAIGRLTDADLADPYVDVETGTGERYPVGVNLDGRWTMPAGWTADDDCGARCPAHPVRPSA